MAETGSLAGGGGVLGVSEPLATAGQDFVSQLASVRLLDGQQSTVISVPIIDVSLVVLSWIQSMQSTYCSC